MKRAITTAAIGCTILAALSAETMAQEEVTIPCGSFAEGNVWRTQTTMEGCNIEGEAVVLSNDRNIIVLGQKTTTTCNYLSAGRSSMQSVETVLKKEGDAVYLIGNRSSGVQTQLRQPFCGKVPSRMTSQMLTTGVGPDMAMDQTITVQEVGRERITVPAGTFETVAVEISTENINKENPASNYNETMIIFATEEVGIAKIIMKMDAKMPAPVSNRGDDQKINKVLQEGIAAMMKGEDTGQIEEKLAAMAKESAGKTEMVERRTTLVTELQSYSIK